jgi:hypothetical protein
MRLDGRQRVSRTRQEKEKSSVDAEADFTELAPNPMGE